MAKIRWRLVMGIASLAATVVLTLPAGATAAQRLGSMTAHKVAMDIWPNDALADIWPNSAVMDIWPNAGVVDPSQDGNAQGDDSQGDNSQS
jgi:hypothetical protein